MRNDSLQHNEKQWKAMKINAMHTVQQCNNCALQLRSDLQVSTQLEMDCAQRSVRHNYWSTQLWQRNPSDGNDCQKCCSNEDQQNINILQWPLKMGIDWGQRRYKRSEVQNISPCILVWCLHSTTLLFWSKCNCRTNLILRLAHRQRICMG